MIRITETGVHFLHLLLVGVVSSIISSLFCPLLFWFFDEPLLSDYLEIVAGALTLCLTFGAPGMIVTSLMALFLFSKLQSKLWKFVWTMAVGNLFALMGIMFFPLAQLAVLLYSLYYTFFFKKV